MIKRFTALLTCAVMLLASTACSDNNNSTESPSETTAAEITTEIQADATAEYIADTTVPSTESATVAEESTAVEESSVTATESNELTTEQIVDLYKAAAAKSGSVRTAQNINLTDISINNGQYEGVLDFVTPIMAKLIANNTEDKVCLRFGNVITIFNTGCCVII